MRTTFKSVIYFAVRLAMNLDPRTIPTAVPPCFYALGASVSCFQGTEYYRKYYIIVSVIAVSPLSSHSTCHLNSALAHFVRMVKP